MSGRMWRGAVLGVAVGLAVAEPARAAPITDNLLAWWEFEAVGPGNTIADVSGNGRNLLLVDNPFADGGGLPTVVAGGVGGGAALQTAPVVPDLDLGPGFPPVPVASGFAMYPDADPDPVDFNAAPTGYAIQLWFNPAQVDLAQGLLFNRDIQTPTSTPRNGWELHLSHKIVGSPSDPAVGKNQLNFFGRSGAGALQVGAFVDVAVNTWHHVLFTASYNAIGGPGNLYFDGVLVASGFASLQIPSFHDLFLGVVDANIFGVPLLLEPLQGRMDKVALWDRSLTPDEVAALYNGGAGFALTPGGGGDGVPAPGAAWLLALGLLAAAGLRRRAPGRSCVPTLWTTPASAAPAPRRWI